jgi:hypothetical protein
VTAHDRYLQAPLDKSAWEELLYEEWEESGTDLDFETWAEERLRGDR